MEINKYIRLIKEIIVAEVKDTPATVKLDPEFFEKLYEKIKDNIRLVAEQIYKYPSVDDKTLKNYYESAKREYLSVNPIDIDPINSLSKPGYETWLDTKRIKEINWNYTARYLKYLEESGRSELVVEETKLSSLEIVSKIGDPKSGESFYVKGMAVGEVQSGKTGNFNAVINRAIDCGYGLVIVLSGIMEDLRSQTQQRIETDIIGEGVDIDSQTFGKKGVGKLERFGQLGNSKIKQVVSITSCKSDFNKSLADADFSLNHTNVLVCKKNVSVLRNLIVWLHDHIDQGKEKHDIALLILDDEADNASLNNEGAKGREYASKINGHIRALLELFNKKTYLGYTASPFANVLQDRNLDPMNNWIIKYKLKGESEEKRLPQVSNLFPDDFIVLLNPPSNYIGAKQLFDTIKPIENKASDKIPLVHVLEDHIESFPARVYDSANGDVIGVENFTNKSEWENAVGEFGSYLGFDSFREYKSITRAGRTTDDLPKAIPKSLKDAILCFILSTAVRESRKPKIINSSLYQPHNTMLIHVSRFTSWQNNTRRLIDAYVKELSSQIMTDKPGSSKSIYFELENIWYKYYAKIIESISDYLPNDYSDEFMTPIVFDSLKKYIPEAITGLEVKAINSVTKDSLEYPKNTPKKIIAIGGNRLSRGFTLEGLTINYFVRTTNYSDTLLQMGRWFGYRPGYLDCCKLFTTQESFEKFNSTTMCIEELEIEFRKMEDMKLSPDKFVLRVKKHPGTLKITRPSILKNSKDVKWSYQDQLEMTTKFNVTKTKMEKVWDVFKNEIAPLFKHSKNNPEGFLTHQTNGKGIIELLGKENNFNSEDAFSMIKFIELCLDDNKLDNWTVAIKTTGAAKLRKGTGVLSPDESNLPEQIKLAIRRGPNVNQEVDRKQFLDKKIFKATGKSANIVSSSKDMSILLTQPMIMSAEKEFLKNRKQYYLNKYKDISESEAIEKASKVNIPERVYREKMNETQGLLIIYLFDSNYSFNQEVKNNDDEFIKLVNDENYNLDIPIIGYAIGFPPIENDPGGEYAQGDYNLDIDDESSEIEYSDEDLVLPNDIGEN